ncbi:alpha/beta fold hydrolase [Rhodoblastus sp.]|uniref:alpha/beta fold hydrolase n=1 Tax=Rhodoblastus sp. TaxID=1962975 RepID=UPI003F9692B2
MLILAALWLILYGLIAFGVLTLFNLALVRLIEMLVPPIGRFIEVGDEASRLRIHVADSGARSGQSEPPLVFIHGLLGQLNEFAYALAARFPERRVVLIDRPGSGYSETAHPQTLAQQAAIVAGAIETLGLEKPLVVGHSLGGAVALALALDHAEKIGGLALVAPLTHLVAPRSKMSGAILGGLAWRSRFIWWLGAWTVGPVLTLLRSGVAREMTFAPDPMPARFWSRGGGLLAARPSALLAAASDLLTQPRELPGMARRYGALDLPIGVLYGEGDRLLDPERQGADFCAETPGAKLSRIAGGHMLPLAHPAETEAFIRGVMARMAPDS